MVAVSIHGMKDGAHKIELSVPVEEVEQMFPEFIGNVTVQGEIQKIGNRYTVQAEVLCSAKLTCDRSLTEFVEPIRANIKTSYIADNELVNVEAAVGEEERSDTVHVIREDDHDIDLSEEVRQELILNLPMKRVAPQYRDKEITEIFPELGKKKGKKEEIDDRWAALKKIKFDSKN
jgi:uncharacterized protein